MANHVAGPPRGSWLACLLVLAQAGCGGVASLPIEAGFGPKPVLPAAQSSLIPTVNIAPAKGWQAGGKPLAGAGMRVDAFATGMEHPRWIHVLPNGDVLVAETNGPVRPGDAPGIKGWVMRMVMKRAGAAVASANRITLLRDADGDGVAEFQSVLLQGLNSPFGMALVGDYLYVANSDAILRFPYVAGQTRISAPGVELVALPAGDINHHWTKNIIASPDGSKLYVTVGSNSNVFENGAAAEVNLGAAVAVRIGGEVHAWTRVRGTDSPCQDRWHHPDAGSARTACRPKRDGPPSGRWTCPVAHIVSLLPACAIPTVWPGHRPPCGPW